MLLLFSPRDWIRDYRAYVSNAAAKSKPSAKGGLEAFVAAADLKPPVSLTLPLVCEHSRLMPAKQARRAVSIEAWMFLRNRFPDGPEFPVVSVLIPLGTLVWTH